MARASSAERRPVAAATVLTVGLVLVALYLAREVFIPLALAVLLTFLLAPVVMWLQRRGIHRVLAVLLTVMMTFAAIGALGWIVTAQMVDLAMRLPEYRENFAAKFEPLRDRAGGIFARASETLRELEKETRVEVQPIPADEPFEPDEAAPVPVSVIEGPASPIQFVRTTLLPLLRPIAMAGIVIVFVIFFLIKREDLRDRLLRVLGPAQLHTSTAALDDAAGRVSRYLLMMGIINGTVGLSLGIGLYFIGVPNPALWGFLSATLRFIPYVGAWTAALMPISVALAVSPGWIEPILTVSLILVIELVSNNIMEPWLYGTGTGISVVAVLLGAVFWTWLWGPVGLLLATPLTVCLVVIGRHVPHLEFLNILLGDEPALNQAEHLYQRLLAMDQGEAAAVAEEYLKEHSPTQLCDDVLVPALKLAEHDRHRERLVDERRVQFVYRSIRALVDDVEGAYEPARPGDRALVLCIPARDEADEIVADMLSRLLQARGLTAAAASVTSTTGERMEEVARREARIVCISALPPFEIIHARTLCKRLRSRFADLIIVVGLWGSTADPQRTRERLSEACSNMILTRLSDVVERAAEALPHEKPIAAPPLEVSVEPANAEKSDRVDGSG